MKYPVLTGNAVRRLHVAALDGGINRRDAAHLIGDTQLADGENVWWRDGALRMRPAFRADEQHVRLVSEPLRVEAEDCTTETVATGCVAYHDGIYGEYVAAIRHLYGTIHGAAAEIEISLLLIDGTRIDTETIFLKDDDTALPHRTVLLVKGDTGVVGEGLFAFVDGGRIYELCHEYAYESQTHRYYWRPITDQVTVPVVMTAGRGYHSKNGNKKDASGLMVRSFNALTNRFIAEYTTDGESNCFVLPLKSAPAEIVSTTYTDVNGVTHTFLSDTLALDGKTVKRSVVGNTVRFFADGEPYCFADSNATCNLRITAAYSANEGVPERYIFSMRCCTWFGGSGGGLHGGARVFMAGNDRQHGTICWSAVGDPLYFPVNNYALVGDAGEAITALAKQSDMLVIFKEHSLYCSTYAAETLDADEVVEGGVTDLDTASAVFPITPLHAFIGCDCPSTVTLCANRLVWATSDRRVYTLTGANPFSERNVFELSGLIRDKLAAVTPSEMQRAIACDYDGHYLLMVGRHAAVLHYGDSAFGNIASYSDAKQAAAALVWYYWSLDTLGARPVHAIAQGDAMVLLAEHRRENPNDPTVNPMVKWITFTAGTGPDSAVAQDGTIGEARITGFVETKRFDFGQPHRRKRIVRLYPETETGGEWTWITDQGESPARTAGAVITPHIHSTARFGMRVAFSGVFSLTGVSVVYQLIGERKG